MWGLGNTWSTCFVMFMLWSGEKCVPCWWFLSATFSLWLQYAQQHPLHHDRGEEWEQNQWNCLSYLDQGENYYVCNWIWVQPSVVNWWFPSCTLARHSRRAAKFLHLEQLVQDIVCEKAFFIVCLCFYEIFSPCHPQLLWNDDLKGYPEMHTNVQSKQVWETIQNSGMSCSGEHCKPRSSTGCQTDWSMLGKIPLKSQGILARRFCQLRHVWTDLAWIPVTYCIASFCSHYSALTQAKLLPNLMGLLLLLKWERLLSKAQVLSNLSLNT